MHVLRGLSRGSWSDGRSSSGKESFVQKLPPGVKSELSGGVFPEMTSPQVHSRQALPSCLRQIAPLGVRSISEFSVLRKSLENPSWA